MRKKVLRPINIKLENIIVFILLYFSSQSFLFGTNINQYYRYFKDVIFILLFVYLAMKSFKAGSNNKKQLLLLSVFFVLLQILTMITNIDNNFNYFRNIFLILLSFEIVSTISFESFKKSFISVMNFLCVTGLFTYFIVSLFPKIINRLPIVYNSITRFGNFLFLNIIRLNQTESWYIRRNWGIFREPGIFALFIIIALIFTLFSSKNEKKDLKKIIIFSLALISTLSTAGFLCLGLVYITYILFSNNKLKNKIIYTLLIGIVIFTTLNLPVLKNALFDKIEYANSSYSSRIYSVILNVKVFTEKPIFGVGETKIYDYFKSNNSFSLYNLRDEEGHNTNTLLKILSKFGIIMFSLVIIGLFYFFKNLNGSNFISILLVIIFAILTSSEDISYSTVFFTFILYGFAYKHQLIAKKSTNQERF